jgi:beta-barrel assembly-enhancing protease
MPARYYDGLSARSHPAEVAWEADHLLIRHGDDRTRWPAVDLSVQIEAGEARVSSRRDPDARLILPEAEWEIVAGDRLEGWRHARRRRELWLVGGLTAIAAGVVLFVTVGVPALSGPVARATPPGMEVRMGQNFDAQVKAVFPTCEGDAGQAVLAALGDRIAARADSPFDIRVRAVEAPMINAFALPGGPVLVTDDLIREVDGPDELAAVIAHEIAHVEQRHVMQAVWRDLGIGMLLDLVVGGGTGAGQQAVILAGQASSLSYDRAAEREADARGQALLHAEGLSSRGMGSFFERLSRIEGASDLSRATEFMNTHPDSRRRVRNARAIERDGRPALSAADWQTVRAACASGSDGPIDRLQRRFRLGDRPPLPNKRDQMGPD